MVGWVSRRVNWPNGQSAAKENPGVASDCPKGQCNRARQPLKCRPGGRRPMNNILIVDDHPLYREGMVSALRTSLADVRVTGASSAEDGLEALAASPDTDLVLVDARLPGADGFAALRLYASLFPPVARMMISGFDDPPLVKRAFSAGASGFIHKSMPVAEVVSAIQRVLAGGVFVPDGAGRAAEKHGSAGEEGAAITLRQLEVLRL